MRPALWLIAIAIGCQQKSLPPAITAERPVDAGPEVITRAPLRYALLGKVVDLHSGKVERTLTEAPSKAEITDEHHELAYVVDAAYKVRAVRLADGATVWTDTGKCVWFDLTEHDFVCVDSGEIRALDRTTGKARVIFTSSKVIASHVTGGSTLAVLEDDRRITLVDIKTGIKTGAAKPTTWATTWANSLVVKPPGLCMISQHRPAVDVACFDAKMNVVWSKHDGGHNPEFAQLLAAEVQTSSNHFVLAYETEGHFKHKVSPYSLIVTWSDKSLQWVPGVIRATIDRPDGTLEYVFSSNREPTTASTPSEEIPGARIIETSFDPKVVTSQTRLFLYSDDKLFAIDRASGAEVFRAKLKPCASRGTSIDLRDDAVIVTCDGEDFYTKERLRFAGVFAASDGRNIMSIPAAN
jgi:outer membrane protein assembly factor BamB